jgi:NADH:ubiquinone oxidoreductase subunit 3 (subunit A)
MLARLVMLVTTAIVVLIIVAILLVLLGANESNSIVQAIQDGANFFVGPFESIFSMSNHKVEVAVNYGLAALVYFIVGSLIARLLRR